MFKIFAFMIFVMKGCFCAVTVNPPITSCDVTDKDCLSAVLNTAFSNIVNGNTQYGIESIDPIYFDELFGDFATIYYRNINNTITGVKEWRFKNVTISPDLKEVQLVLDCPGFRLEGITRLEGYCNSIPLLALGPFSIEYGRYEITVYSSFSLDVDERGNVFGQFGKTSIVPKALSPTKYSYTLVFSGSNIYTAAANELLSQGWEEDAFFSDYPIVYPIVEKVLTNLNQYFVLSV